MIVDTSAIVAIVRREPRGLESLAALRAAQTADQDRLMSAATYLELGIVVDGRRDAVLSRRVSELLTELGVQVVAFDDVQADAARQAYREFGKASAHPAHLTFGDCFSYALASARRQALLFVGEDFTHTDVCAVL